jgi:hypothetical protein
MKPILLTVAGAERHKPGRRYGIKEIPEKWIRSLARHDEIELLFNHFTDLVPSSK